MTRVRAVLLVAVAAFAPGAPTIAGIPEMEVGLPRPVERTDLAEQLARPERSREALEAALVRPDAEEALGRVAAADVDTAARGWAIVGLTRVPGQGAARRLDQLAADPEAPVVVRTWARAGRIARAESLAELSELGKWQHRGFPALDRPLRLRAEQLVQGAPLADLLRASAEPSLQPLIAPHVLTAANEPALVEAIYGSSDDVVRRQAAAFAAARATQAPGQSGIATLVLTELRFRKTEPPWAGGALYVPALGWQGADADQLVDRLTRWWLYLSEVGDAPDEARQVWNNLYSYQLLTACGYDMSLRADPVELVRAVARVKGRERARALLGDVGLARDPRFAQVLR